MHASSCAVFLRPLRSITPTQVAITTSLAGLNSLCLDQRLGRLWAVTRIKLIIPQLHVPSKSAVITDTLFVSQVASHSVADSTASPTISSDFSKASSQVATVVHRVQMT